MDKNPIEKDIASIEIYCFIALQINNTQQPQSKSIGKKPHYCPLP